MARVRVPSGTHEKHHEFFPVKTVVLIRCRCTCPTTCVCTQYALHKNGHVAHFKDHVVHVRVRWITETRRYQAHALVGLGNAAFCGCCSLTQVRRPKFPKRDKNVCIFFFNIFFLKSPMKQWSENKSSVKMFYASACVFTRPGEALPVLVVMVTPHP